MSSRKNHLHSVKLQNQPPSLLSIFHYIHCPSQSVRFKFHKIIVGIKTCVQTGGFPKPLYKLRLLENSHYYWKWISSQGSSFPYSCLHSAEIYHSWKEVYVTVFLSPLVWKQTAMVRWVNGCYLLTGFIAVLVLCSLEELFTDDPGRWRGEEGGFCAGRTEMVYSSYTHTHIHTQTCTRT